MSGTATVGGGNDYTFTDLGVIDFDKDENRYVISADMDLIQYLADCEQEDSETIILSLTSPTNDAILGDQASTTITIFDDDRKHWCYVCVFILKTISNHKLILQSCVMLLGRLIFYSKQVHCITRDRN